MKSTRGGKVSEWCDRQVLRYSLGQAGIPSETVWLRLPILALLFVFAMIVYVIEDVMTR